MSVPKYETSHVNPEVYSGYLEFVDIFDSHKFYSQGKNGEFELRTMIFRLKANPDGNYYNLGFGVWDSAQQALIDTIQTRNDDTKRILATVADIALDFISRNPFAELYAEGSTFARTRLYQREILKIIDELSPELRIQGLIRKDDIGFIEFRKGINFDAFLLTAKKL